MGERLKGLSFDKVLISPLQRARRTCELAGFGAQAEDAPDLVEWDYGDYDGLTTAEIRRSRPTWHLFRDGCPGGESVAAAGARADRDVDSSRAIGGRLLLFGHGHFFRVVAARWMGLATAEARHLMLSTASLSILSYEHSLDDPAILLWNDTSHIKP
ncbi:MAG: histidine phosphatase family protein [Isosphaeraceae bacterium]